MIPAYDDFEWTTPARLTLLARNEFPWRHYLRTVVQFSGPNCSGTVLPVAPGTGEETPPFGPLHVIAVVQPEAEPDNGENIARMAVLDRELRDVGLQALPAVGASLDGRHREDSRAVFGLDDGQARALGRRFGQVAVFAWRGTDWSLLACAADRQTHRGWLWDPAPDC
ncbi:DUF3293 domain-containing protein [Mycobacterium celatum]|uniref:DUF3293 domain-containing protein n=1 Tax=Mycobacterium celatum TaxID=28045 RepID=A0A1X1RMH5_MYCCE|nr:DUF3293 domain-containing protein [Mycobacterium celatum]ORV09808.1 hypothetical protein AWB95_16340 [Mycobacterium celatum]PIB79616.1 DUF3293 domain-containing protein [Mycobacterium celatum]